MHISHRGIVWQCGTGWLDSSRALLAWGYFEPVADIPYGLDKCRVSRVRLNLATKGGDAAVHTAVRYDHFIAPDGLQDAVAGQCAAGAFHKKLQQSKFFGGEINLRPMLEQFVGR